MTRAVQLGSRRCHQEQPLLPTRVWAQGPFSPKSQMSDVVHPPLSEGKAPSAASGEAKGGGRPRVSARRWKNIITMLILLWSAAAVMATKLLTTFPSKSIHTLWTFFFYRLQPQTSKLECSFGVEGKCMACICIQQRAEPVSAGIIVFSIPDFHI